MIVAARSRPLNLDAAIVAIPVALFAIGTFGSGAFAYSVPLAASCILGWTQLGGT